MKKTALLLVILACLLLCACTIGGSGTVFGAYTYEQPGRYTAGEGTISGNVTAIDLDWLEGSVTIVCHDGSDVELRETADHHLTKGEQVHWLLDGSTLRIRYAASGFRSARSMNKQLTVLLPRDIYLKLLEVSGVSADLAVTGLSMDAMQVETVSGDVAIDCGDVAGKMTLNSVSGSMNVNVASAREVVAETVSGDVEMAFGAAPKKISADAVSGDITVVLPQGAGFTADLDTVSGEVNTDDFQGRSGGKFTIGDGACRISAETVSGDLTVRCQK